MPVIIYINTTVFPIPPPPEEIVGEWMLWDFDPFDRDLSLGGMVVLQVFT